MSDPVRVTVNGLTVGHASGWSFREGVITPVELRPPHSGTVYLVTTGDGEGGSEWDVLAAFTTRAGAEAYIAAHNAHRPAWAHVRNPVEEWPLDKPFDPADFPHGPPKGD